jgi:hypothetical protein
VDRAIRESEIDGLEEGEWEAKVTELVAKEPKEYACALGQARQRMEEETRTIRDLERKLKEVGKI